MVGKTLDDGKSSQQWKFSTANRVAASIPPPGTFLQVTRCTFLWTTHFLDVVAEWPLSDPCHVSLNVLAALRLYIDKLRAHISLAPVPCLPLSTNLSRPDLSSSALPSMSVL